MVAKSTTKAGLSTETTNEVIMKAIVIARYGGPEVMEYQDYPDPSPGPDEVLVRVAATSINPFDIKRRSGEAKAFAPISFPGVIGVDLAGTVISCGREVQRFSAGERVFGMAVQTYAERCVAKAENLAKVPVGLDLVGAAAIPLVTTTGYELIMKGALVQPGQSVLVTGALGNVGRSAVFTAKSLGARVIAGVRKKQLEQAGELHADSIVAVDDQAALSSLQPLDAVADTVNGPTAELLIGKVKAGGIFASVLGPPQNSAQYPAVKVVPVYGQSDTKALLTMATAVVEGKLTIPIASKMPLKDAAQAHVLVAKGINGKVLLVP
jgi:NADPH:quinone reductase-like Zn-dependent oxidoreductase